MSLQTSAKTIIQIPKSEAASVLCFEDDERRIAFFKSRLPEATYVNDAESAIGAISRRQYAWYFLDCQIVTCWTDMNGQTAVPLSGVRVVRALLSRPPAQYVIHSLHETGVRQMYALLKGRDVQVRPYGSFDLEVV